jgi:Rrf2 family iron-sulfur cluster assembly transcriptional regulator
MRISAIEEYGLRCILALAREGVDGQLTIPDIAEMEGLSVPYASKLLSILRKKGLIDSVRGRSGGFRIARPADRINLLEVLTALDGPLVAPDHCSRFSGQLEKCIHGERCSVHDVLGDLAGYIGGFLERATLQQILDSRPAVGTGETGRSGGGGGTVLTVLSDRRSPAGQESNKTKTSNLSQ